MSTLDITRDNFNGDLRLYRVLFKIPDEIRLHDSGKKFVRAVDCQGGFRQSRTQSYHGNTGLLVMIRILLKGKR